MQSRTFYVNANIDYLSQWLVLAHKGLVFYLDGKHFIKLDNGNHLKILGDLNDPLEDLLSLPEIGPDHTVEKHFGIIAKQGWIQDSKLCWHIPLAFPLNYRLISLNFNRVKIVAECCYDELSPFFNQMLGTLKADYPGMTERVGAAIAEQAELENENTNVAKQEETNMRLTLSHNEVASIVGPELRRRGIPFRQERDGDTISYIVINDNNVEVGAFVTSPNKTHIEMFPSCPDEDMESLGKILRILGSAIWREQERKEWIKEKATEIDAPITDADHPSSTAERQVVDADTILVNVPRFGKEILQLSLEERYLLLLDEHERLAHLFWPNGQNAIHYVEEQLLNLSGHIISAGEGNRILRILAGRGDIRYSNNMAAITDKGIARAADIEKTLQPALDVAVQVKPADHETAVPEQSEQANEDTTIENPWDKIPDHSWDRRAVQMLWERYQDPEIARELNVGIVSKTVTNRLSLLRQQFPDLIPTRAKLRKKA